MKKIYIPVWCGILEAKHRDKLGPAWYLFFYMLNRANWRTGEIVQWIDRDAAEELEAPITTIREHRRRLEDELYIRTDQKQYYLSIRILKFKSLWLYYKKNNGLSEGNTSPETPDLVRGEAQGEAQGAEDTSLLHIDSKNQITKEKEKINPKTIPQKVQELMAFYLRQTFKDPASVTDDDWRSIIELSEYGISDPVMKALIGMCPNGKTPQDVLEQFKRTSAYRNIRHKREKA